jgi:hypothetical protein
MVTDRAREGAFTAALEEISALGVTNGAPVTMRIEDLGAEK